MDKEKLLKIRAQSKKKKPNFLRRNYSKLKLKSVWRKPRGLHNKLRLKRKGHIKNPSTGYRSPRKVRNTDKMGFIPVLVSNTKEIEKLNPQQNSLIFKSGVGIKNKISMLDKAREMNFNVLNNKDLASSKQKLEQLIDARKKKKLEQLKLKQQVKSQPKKEKVEVKKDIKGELDKDQKDILLHQHEIKHKDVIDTPDKSPRENITRTKITAGKRQ